MDIHAHLSLMLLLHLPGMPYFLLPTVMFSCWLCEYHLLSSAFPNYHSLPPSKSVLIDATCLATQLLLKGKHLIFIHLDICRI